MTLEEAITHAQEQATSLGCSECGAEHQQLAEWLRELKGYKDNDWKLLNSAPPTVEYHYRY